MTDHTIRSDDYHDYVIKDGRLVGEFEQMYRNCENPWPETEADIAENPASNRTPCVINRDGLRKVFSLGCGKGMHLAWLKRRCPDIEVAGGDISPTAVQECLRAYPFIDARVLDVKDFSSHVLDFDVIILREVVWYILDQWDAVCVHLKRAHAGKRIIVELSFYDQQQYGLDRFDGPDDFVSKFPFPIFEVVRWHVTRAQREGMLFLYGEI